MLLCCHKGVVMLSRGLALLFFVLLTHAAWAASVASHLQEPRNRVFFESFLSLSQPAVDPKDAKPPAMESGRRGLYNVSDALHLFKAARLMGELVAMKNLHQHEALQRYFYMLPFVQETLSVDVLQDVCNIMGWIREREFVSDIVYDADLYERDFSSIDEWYFGRIYVENAALYDTISPLLRAKRFKEVHYLLPKVIENLQVQSLAGPFFQYIAMRRLWKEGLRTCIGESGLQDAQPCVEAIDSLLNEPIEPILLRFCRAVKGLTRAEGVLKKKWSDAFACSMELVRMRGLIGAKIRGMEGALFLLEVSR